MKRNCLLMLLALVVTAFVLTGCVPGDGHNTPQDPAGFFWGVWHGWIAPVSLILGFFKKGIRIYETANEGLIYDLGFYMAVISGFGGLSFFRRQRSSNGK